jgi:hypothetical protein
VTLTFFDIIKNYHDNFLMRWKKFLVWPDPYFTFLHYSCSQFKNNLEKLNKRLEYSYARVCSSVFLSLVIVIVIAVDHVIRAVHHKLFCKSESKLIFQAKRFPVFSRLLTILLLHGALGEEFVFPFLVLFLFFRIFRHFFCVGCSIYQCQGYFIFLDISFYEFYCRLLQILDLLMRNIFK